MPKFDPTDYLLQVQHLTTEFDRFSNELGGPHFRPAWAGTVLYFATLENA